MLWLDQHCISTLLSAVAAAVQMKAQGKFYADKLDMLVSYLIVQPFQSAWEKLAPESLKVSTLQAFKDL